ncbi:MAG: caspase family protein [Cyanobacteria bacterium P01_A01_bin.137]
MPQFKRRHFLQLSGSTLASIGLSQTGFIKQCDRYGKALAQDTSRKLALLIGINNYPKEIGSLRGCLTDVELQYELLVHRFGFLPENIKIISDPIEGVLSDRVVAPPTRENILGAFEDHLINQAKEGDVVVFHYSGHGSRVKDDNGIPGFNNKNGTLVPSDGRSNLSPDSNQVNDIMGKTLFLLTYALKTDNVSLILDSCHSGGGIRGNLVFRAISDRLLSGNAEPSQIELDYQDMWRRHNGLSPKQLRDLRRVGIAKGMALGSSRISQLAAEAPFGDFRAGAFTYLLTRYLWQQVNNQSLDTVFVNLARSTSDVAKKAGVPQDPIYEVQPGSNAEQQPPLFIAPPNPSAEAVIRQIEGNQVTFWLGGVSPQNLEFFNDDATFNLIDATGNPIGEINQTSRVGLQGYGTINTSSRSAATGALMREQVRGIPSDLSLRVGVDVSLADEKALFTEALANVSRVTVVNVDQTQPVDYLVGRLTSSHKVQAANQNVTINDPIGSIGLFTPDLTPIPDSFGQLNESLETTLARLRPRMKMLLAGRILKAVVNSDVSDINVDVKVTPVASGGILFSRGSRVAQETGIVAQSIDTGIQQVKVGDQIKIEVTNNEPKDLHVSILVINSSGELIVLHPVTWEAAELDTLIKARQTIEIPGTDSNFDFEVSGPAGHFELLILASTEPLRDALRALRQVARGRGIRSGDPILLGEGATRSPNEGDDTPVQIVDDLLSDLNRNARGNRFSSEFRGSDASRLAAFSAVFEVIE